ncbi:MAG: putative ABC exporter domain-containing protein, partial [Clostridia bacterium]|nr:putative ABC exporter domain-containing protein [Clostridia bacterium]
MRLFGYYAFHSFKNQLKKMFKSWVIIFILVCALLGGLIGFGVSKLSELSEQTPSPPEGEIISEEITLPAEEIETVFADPKTKFGVLELVAGGVVLLLLALNAMRADKSGSAIFLPADVPLLFASPMKPQSVLMFRLMTQIGTAIFGSVYLLAQLPNLTLRLGLSLWAALAVILAWALLIVYSRLLQVLLYTFGSNHPGFQKNLRYGIYAVLAAVAFGFALFWKSSGEAIVPAALRFFNAPASRLIPVWDWFKGFCVHAASGETISALLYLAALIVGGGALIYLIWRIKADFYEDAMAKSEEVAELLRRAQESRTGIVRRKKDRSEKLRRDGMEHGFGANVFFFKSLYNRFRFAHLHVFTKTAETYLFAAAALSILLRFVLHTRTLLPVALALGVLTFFRALGNPLAEDTKMDYFIMIPESAWAKMFWSLLAGTVNCLLDLLPAMIAAVLLLGASPLQALAWMLFIASVDFYATIVGVFLDVSLSRSIGKTVKQVIQMMFLYFGLIPDAGILAVGVTLSKVA